MKRKNTSYKTNWKIACFWLATAETMEELEARWNETQNYPYGPRCADVTRSYIKRASELSGISYIDADGDVIEMIANDVSEEQTATVSAVDRRVIWEQRIKSYREKIIEEERKMLEAKAVVKTHQETIRALSSTLNQLLDDGVDGFELNQTPLLSLAEEQDADIKAYGE